MPKNQVSISLTEELYERLPDLLAKVREQMGAPNLSMADVFAMGLQVLEQWLDLVVKDQPAMLEKIDPPKPLEGARKRKPGGGRKRKPKEEPPP